MKMIKINDNDKYFRGKELKLSYEDSLYSCIEITKNDFKLATKGGLKLHDARARRLVFYGFVDDDNKIVYKQEFKYYTMGGGRSVFKLFYYK